MTASAPVLPTPWRVVVDPDAVGAVVGREAARDAEDARRLHPACVLAVAEATPPLAVAFLQDPAVLVWATSAEAWRRRRAPAARGIVALAKALGLALDRERAWSWHHRGITVHDGVIMATADLPVIAADPLPVRCAEMLGDNGRPCRDLVITAPDGEEEIFSLDENGQISRSDYRDDATARSLIAAQRALGIRIRVDGASFCWDGRDVITVTAPDGRVVHWSEGATPVDGHPGIFVLADGAIGSIRNRSSGARIILIKRLDRGRLDSHDNAGAVLDALRATDPRGLRHGAASLLLHGDRQFCSDDRFALHPVLTAAGWVPLCAAGVIIAEAETGSHRCTVRRLDAPLGGAGVSAYVSVVAEPTLPGALPWQASIALTVNGAFEHILRDPGEPLDAAGLALLRTAAGVRTRPHPVRHGALPPSAPALVRTARGWSPAVLGAARGAWEVVEADGRIAALDPVGRIAWIMPTPRGAVARPTLFADTAEPFRLLARTVAARGAALGKDWASTAVRHGCVLRQGRVMLVEAHALDGHRVEHAATAIVLVRDPTSTAAPAGSTEAWAVRREADGRTLGTLSITLEGRLRSSPRGGEGRALLAVAESSARARLAEVRPASPAADAVLEVLRGEAWLTAAALPPEGMRELAERLAAAALATKPRGRSEPP